MTAGVVARAAAWIEQDPDAHTRAELQSLLDRVAAADPEATADLDERFSGTLAFGTAGLRAEIGAGPMRMNRVVVARAAAGFARFLIEERGAAGRTIVVGYDARHNSDVFARDSAEIFAGAGLKPVLLPRALPTPVLAFAVRHLDAAGGVMVTASHNPPHDNGYKVYLGDEDGGAQIVAPADAKIAAAITAVAEHAITHIARAEAYSVANDDIVHAYVAATAAVAPASDSAASLRVVYTPLHGVGAEVVRAVLRRAGYPDVEIVAEQRDPDPDFPTVAFPNPEEDGALDLAFALATRTRAHLIVANDPDADRLAVAVPNGEGWRQLTGNEVGLLLGWRAAALAASTPGASLASSLVSSPGLGVVAQKYSLDYHPTLTGFKWISRAPGIVFGYEEALGYLVNPDTVRDKDGISALVAVLDLAASAHAQGSDLAAVIDGLADEFGHFSSGQVSLRVDDLSVIDHAMAELRAHPPTEIAGIAVTAYDDLLKTDAASAGSNILRFELADGARVIARPSGTEPKLKVYLDVRGTSAADASERLAALDASVRQLIDALTSRQ